MATKKDEVLDGILNEGATEETSTKKMSAAQKIKAAQKKAEDEAAAKQKEEEEEQLEQEESQNLKNEKIEGEKEMEAKNEKVTEESLKESINRDSTEELEEILNSIEEEDVDDSEIEEMSVSGFEKKELLNKMKIVAGNRRFKTEEIRKIILLKVDNIINVLKETFNIDVVIDPSEKAVFNTIAALKISDVYKEKIYTEVTASESIKNPLKMILPYENYTRLVASDILSVGGKKKIRTPDIDKIAREFRDILPRVTDENGKNRPSIVATFVTDDKELHIYLSWDAVLTMTLADIDLPNRIGRESNEFDAPDIFYNPNRSNLDRSDIQLVFTRNDYVEMSGK